MYLFDACPQIFFGEDSLKHLDTLPDEKVMLVCDPYMEESGTSRTVTDRLEARGIPYSVFSKVEPDPSIETISAGMQHLFSEKPETLIALGGGSAIDATKAILYFCMKTKGSLMGEKYIHKPLFVVIPTTSGTGSEVTSYAVVTDRQQGVKIPLNERCMTPDVAILCPAYTKTLPKNMVAFTGMDVLTHALEAYVTRESNAFTDMHAKEAARKTLRYLPRAWAGENDMKPLEEMMVASTMAGLAFSNSGLGVCHGLAHSIGGAFHLPHGKANAIILPYVLAFNAGLGPYTPQPAVMARYAMLAHQLGRQLGFDAPDDRGVVTHLLEEVLELGRVFGIPASLKAEGIPEKDFYAQIDVIANNVMQDITTEVNPVPVTYETAKRLLQDVYEGTKIL